ncbi:hypothetical protein PPROV_001038800 [Pycnococcus provasolii]|uniref:Uncharacterized protein n=1 Tax=Pycnococcus provasolii TaxID=41880 RepID=A0A830I0R8_9CHLO|nr:hypothetical protein PPROV_001038800 [Pycnococcus provasolii]
MALMVGIGGAPRSDSCNSNEELTARNGLKNDPSGAGNPFPLCALHILRQGTEAPRDREIIDDDRIQTAFSPYSGTSSADASGATAGGASAGASGASSSSSSSSSPPIPFCV